jgi:hypothetical protein
MVLKEKDRKVQFEKFMSSLFQKSTQQSPSQSMSGLGSLVKSAHNDLSFALMSKGELNKGGQTDEKKEGVIPYHTSIKKVLKNLDSVATSSSKENIVLTSIESKEFNRMVS